MNPTFLDIEGQKIAVYESAGKGKNVMLVHGNSANAGTFKHQFEGEFGDTYHVVAFDLPGHGASDKAREPENTYHMPGYAKILVEVAKQMNMNDAVFVGWSLGGHIVLEAISELPDAAGFMIYGTPPIAFPPAMGEAFFPNPAMNAGFSAEVSREEAKAFTDAFFKAGGVAPESFIEDVLNTDGMARAIMGASVGQANYKDEVEIVANMTQPLAVFHGAEEQLVNADYISGLNMPTLWRSAVQKIADAGHVTHWEQAEAFNELLTAFIEDCYRD
ncbi:MAG TPA: alpha/beta hydrolase [Gammaproteobacteria bacterium]|nr:alpha/beta hydrolase [Gammaproteobacteria bacterium]